MTLTDLAADPETAELAFRGHLRTFHRRLNNYHFGGRLTPPLIEFAAPGDAPGPGRPGPRR
ncbi:MAG TPA: hypothetical protein VG276_29365 [Actinomycetes bacterium]|nr:hypothetical protein [Actinomycetes bacterium]